MAFAHEKLLVYRKALDYFEDTQGALTSWSKQHAFVDHLARASESILFNLVEAVRLPRGRRKARTLDYALGSVYECAGCMDIAAVKRLGRGQDIRQQKSQLLELCKMLIGLRKSWAPPVVAEDRAAYNSGQSEHGGEAQFSHENLDSYCVALDLCRWLFATTPGRNLGTAPGRAADAMATRIVLNIAEGNGRYSELSQRTFLDTANAAAAKLATLLDMGARQGTWDAEEVAAGKALLLRLAQMTAASRQPRP